MSWFSDYAKAKSIDVDMTPRVKDVYDEPQRVKISTITPMDNELFSGSERAIWCDHDGDHVLVPVEHWTRISEMARENSL